MTRMIPKIRKIINSASLTISLSDFIFSRIVLFWAVAEIKEDSFSSDFQSSIPLTHFG